MRIALYSPLIPAGQTLPSGAAAATRVLETALGIAGHRVDRPSRLCTVIEVMDPARVERLRTIGQRQAQRLLRRYRAAAPEARPDVWITYGIRANAPDWLGPSISLALDIPYVLVDPRGPATPTDAVPGDPFARVPAAAAVIAMSEASARLAENALPDGERPARLVPFIDPAPYDALRRQHEPHRAAIMGRLRLNPSSPWLLSVGMMRRGDSLTSYQTLARALSRLVPLDWQLIVVGDGPARGQVEAAMRFLPLDRVRFTGALPHDDLMPYYAISDLLVAPSVGGTHGRTLLEAQSAGLPVVAGDAPGVRDAVHDGVTGKLCAPGNAEALANAVAFLLRHPGFRDSFADAAARTIAQDHHIISAAQALDEVLSALTTAVN